MLNNGAPLEAVLTGVRSSLEGSGILQKIRVRRCQVSERRERRQARHYAPPLQAELRAAVVNALEGPPDATATFRSSIAPAVRSDPPTALALALVFDLLSALQLPQSRACILAEAGLVRGVGTVFWWSKVPLNHRPPQRASKPRLQTMSPGCSMLRMRRALRSPPYPLRPDGARSRAPPQSCGRGLCAPRRPHRQPLRLRRRCPSRCCAPRPRRQRALPLPPPPPA